MCLAGIQQILIAYYFILPVGNQINNLPRTKYHILTAFTMLEIMSEVDLTDFIN